MLDRSVDTAVRSSAFAWLQDLVRAHGDVLPYHSLTQGFDFRGTRVPLLGPQGIFKPKLLEIPLSIATSPSSPYSDHFDERNGLLDYKYRGTDPEHRDNRGLRQAMQLRLPLVYLHGLLPGRYFATWPVFVVGDDPSRLTFSVVAEDARQIRSLSDAGVASDRPSESDDARRRYVTREVITRLHQRSFRERVLAAYRQQCALCRLRHTQLLEAAHIIPDADDRGEPIISNGVALCALHHTAFDRFFIGIRPDYRVEVRPDLLREKDGPTLLHAIQGLHDTVISVPSNRAQRPDPNRLLIRYEDFRRAAGGL